MEGLLVGLEQIGGREGYPWWPLPVGTSLIEDVFFFVDYSGFASSVVRCGWQCHEEEKQWALKLDAGSALWPQCLPVVMVFGHVTPQTLCFLTETCWKALVRINGANMVSTQHCYGHDSVNFLLLPFSLHPKPWGGGGQVTLCTVLSMSAGLSQGHIPSWLSRYISRNLDFLRRGFQIRVYSSAPRWTRRQ